MTRLFQPMGCLRHQHVRRKVPVELRDLEHQAISHAAPVSQKPQILL